jgi:hypothetical protein
MNNQRFSGQNRCQLQRSHRWKAYWTKELARGPGENNTLNTWSSGRDVQLKMSAGRMKKRFKIMDRLCESSWTGAHENFQARVYDAGASPTSSESGCYTSTLLTLISVTSVACCSQVLQVSRKEYCHDAYVILMMTLRRHSKCLKHLV